MRCSASASRSGGAIRRRATADEVCAARRLMPRWRSAIGISAAVLGAVVLLAWWTREATSERGGQVELCGYGLIAPISTTDEFPPEITRAAQKAFVRVGAALAAQVEPRSQAVGRYAGLVAAMRSSAEADRQLGDCTDAQCMQRRLRAARETARPHAEGLAGLATSSSDAGVTALALFACQLNRDSGPCARLSVAAWAQLEPGNAVPWIHLAEEARVRNDEPGLRAALDAAARAQTLRPHAAQLLGMAEHPAALSLTPAQRLVYLSQLLGVYAAAPVPPYQALNQACTAAAMTDPSRRRTCDGLATLLTERGDSLLELSLGIAIGERAGWTAERVAALREQRDAMRFLGQTDVVPEDVSSCRFLQRLEERTRELATIGELASARRQLAASDRPPATLAAAWRDLQRQQRDQRPAGGEAAR
jgi:hypothetical protein